MFSYFVDTALGSDLESFLAGRSGEAAVQAHKQPRSWALVRPHQGGGQLQRIGGAERVALNQNEREFANSLGRQDLDPPIAQRS